MIDYLIVGGSLAGCDLATRLKQYDPTASITVVESGPNEHANLLMFELMDTFQLHLSKYKNDYKTVQQQHCNGRQAPTPEETVLKLQQCQRCHVDSRRSSQLGEARQRPELERSRPVAILPQDRNPL